MQPLSGQFPLTGKFVDMSSPEQTFKPVSKNHDHDDDQEQNGTQIIEGKKHTGVGIKLGSEMSLFNSRKSNLMPNDESTTQQMSKNTKHMLSTSFEATKPVTIQETLVQNTHNNSSRDQTKDTKALVENLTKGAQEASGKLQGNQNQEVASLEEVQVQKENNALNW